MFATRTQAQNAYDAADAERSTAEARVAASKRYKGRAADLRLIASLTEICWTAARAIEEFDTTPPTPDYDAGGYAPLPNGCMLDAEAQTEYEAWEADDIAATHTADAARTEAFRERVATRAYFMWLNGEGSNDEARWFEAEAFERGAAIQAARDALPEHHYGQWQTPSQRRRVERMAGLH